MAPVPTTMVIAATAPTPPNPQSPTAVLISVPTQHKKEVVIIFVIEATARMAPLFPSLFENYVDPILRQLRAPILIEGEDKSQKTKINPVLKYGLVTYADDSGNAVEKKYFTADYDIFQRFLRGILFTDGGLFRNAVTEGLVAAAELFEEHAMSRAGLTASHRPDLIRHCILIANSSPHRMGARHNTHEKYDGFYLHNVADEMAKENVYLSLIIPRTGLTELEELVKKVNGNRADIHVVTDVIDPSHVVRLAGFKLPTLSKELKYENYMMPMLGGAESGQASTTSASVAPQPKRIKRDNSPMQIPIPKPQLDIKVSMPMAIPNSTTVSQSSIAGISTAASKGLSPEQVKRIQQAKIKEDAGKNTLATGLPVPLTGAVPKVALTPTVGLPPQVPIAAPVMGAIPGLVPGQKMTAQMLAARGLTATQIALIQQKNLFEQQKQEQAQHIAQTQGIVPVNTQSMTNLNLPVNPMAAGINPLAMNRPSPQMGFVPGVSPIPQQQLQQQTSTGLLNTSSILTQAMGLQPNAIPGSTLSPQQQQQAMQQLIARQVQTNLSQQQGAVARPPGPNNMLPGVPRLPPAVWQGNIVWSIKDSGTGRLREFTCHCHAIPAIQSKDFQPNLWPQKLQITQLMPANMQLLQDRATQMKLPYCMIKPSDPNNIASKNYFALLTRSLEQKRIVATVPFLRPPNAPASELGPFGIVLVYINLKLIGLVFLNTSIPNLGGIGPQPPQQAQQQQQLQQLQLQQQQQQQQQQQPNQQTIPIQLSANAAGMGSVNVSSLGMNPAGVNPVGVNPVGVNPTNFTGVNPMNMEALQRTLIEQELRRLQQVRNTAATPGQPFDPSITNFLQSNSDIPNRSDFNLNQQQRALFASMQLGVQPKPSG